MLLGSASIRRAVCFAAFFIALAWPYLCIADDVPIAPKKLKFIPDKNCYIPYASNLPLDEKNEGVSYVLVMIHSSSFDASWTMENTLEMLDLFDLRQKCLVFAPQFLKHEHIEGKSFHDLVYWDVNPFWGSNNAKTLPDKKKFMVSAYDIVDDVLKDLSRKDHFPNLEYVILCGHSAGGQFANRYAAANAVEPFLTKADIGIQYVVMSPSSYVYMSPKRSVDSSRGEFAVPPDSILEKVPQYNHYGYGLEVLYSYHKRHGLTAEKIRAQFQERNVLYLLGREDTKEAWLDTSPAAMLEGRHRLERGLIYYGHLIDEFGAGIKKKQKVYVIPGAGHSSRKIMFSPLGSKQILRPILLRERAALKKLTR